MVSHLNPKRSATVLRSLAVATVVLGLLGFRAPAARAGGLQIGADLGLESGPYRGDGTGAGYGIEAGWNIDPRRAVFAALNAGSSDRGDSDPNIWAAIEGRFRIHLNSGDGSVTAYASIGLGAGLLWNPLPRVAAGLFTVPIEVGLEVGHPGGAAMVLAIRERPIVTIGDGDPAFSFLNRIGPAVAIRFW